jgi:hypothetical protein
MPEMARMFAEFLVPGVGHKSRLHLEESSADAPSGLPFHAGFALEGFVDPDAPFATAGAVGCGVRGLVATLTAGRALSAGRGAIGLAGGLVVEVMWLFLPSRVHQVDA